MFFLLQLIILHVVFADVLQAMDDDKQLNAHRDSLRVTVYGYFLVLYLRCASGIICVMRKHLESIRFLEKENAVLTKLVAELCAELAVLRDENAASRENLR
jgi:hypothetical protein